MQFVNHSTSWREKCTFGRPRQSTRAKKRPSRTRPRSAGIPHSCDSFLLHVLQRKAARKPLALFQRYVPTFSMQFGRSGLKPSALQTPHNSEVGLPPALARFGRTAEGTGASRNCRTNSSSLASSERIAQNETICESTCVDAITRAKLFCACSLLLTVPAKQEHSRVCPTGRNGNFNS